MRYTLFWSVWALMSVVALWDFLAIVSGRSDDTVSRIFLDWSQANPIFPFLVGLLSGHLFWPQIYGRQ